MSEFLAEARVLVLPDTKGFKTALEAQLKAIHVAPISVPVVAAGAGIAAAAAATSSLAAAQKVAAVGALDLDTDEKILNSTLARQAVLLETLTAAQLKNAGADETRRRAARRSASELLGAGNATGKLSSALLGLRTLLGTPAVIGLSGLALGAITAGQAIRKMIIDTAAFEKELNTFRAVTGATADEMKDVSEAALQLGADVSLPAVTAADAAIALTELGKAGLTVQDALAGVEGVLQLATAAQISNAEAAKLAANALNSFGLAGEQATRVADLFANAANAAQGSVSDIGIAFQQASAVARQVGLSLEDTTAILSLFAKNGLQGSDAGTSLRVALIRLVAPTKEAAAEIKRLGLNIRDVETGAVRADVFAQFGEATKNLTPAARDASAALIFGQDAIRAVSIGAREGAEGLRFMQASIDKTGTAAEVAAARTEGFSGAMEGLNSSLTTLGITFGGPVNRTLTAFAEGATTATDGINRLTKALGDLFSRAATPPQESRDFFGDVSDFSERAIAPITRVRDRFRETVDVIDSGGLSASQNLRALNKELSALEDARAFALTPGSAQPEVADKLTKRIQALREEINRLKKDGDGIDESITSPIGRAVAQLEKVKAIKIARGDLDTSGIQNLIDQLNAGADAAGRATIRINDLPDGIGKVGDASQIAAANVDKLVSAMQRLTNQSVVLQDQLQKAVAEGASPQTQIGLLQQNNLIQQQKIAQAERGGRQSGDITAIREARDQIISNNSKIESLQNEIDADQKEAVDKAKKAADEAEKKRKERNEQIARLLEAASTPIERLLTRAGTTDPLKDDIKFTTQLVQLYKRQIVEATKRITDVEIRNRVLASLDKKLFDAIQDRKRLQAENRKAIRDAFVERQERITRGLELDIELADLNENTQRSINLRLKLIARLKKEARLLKLQGNALKENRNERARIRQEIEDIKNDEEKGDPKAAQKFLFEQLQAQQGFAANLMGNLITGPTAGLVGVPSPPSQNLRTESAAAEARATFGPSAGQTNTQTNVLEKILVELRKLNGSYDAPEAINNKKTGAATMDSQPM